MLHARLLHYIDEVARHGSIRAAGARLHVAPSAINRQILLFEQELGEPIFDRLPRGMRLTPAGEVLVAHIRDTLQRYRSVVTEIRDLREMPSGEIVVDTMTGLASSIVATAAARFSARYPDVRVSIRALTAFDIQRGVTDGDADLGLGFNLPVSSQFDIMWQADTRLGAVLSPQHPLAPLESIPLAACAEYPLIFADETMVIHGIVAEAFARAGLGVEPAYRTNSFETMKRLAASSEAIAFLSSFDVAEELHTGVLTFRPVRARVFSDNILTLVRKEKPGHGQAALLFAEELTLALDAVAF